MTEKTPEELSNQTDYMFKYSQITTEQKTMTSRGLKDFYLYLFMRNLKISISECLDNLIDSDASSVEVITLIHPDLVKDVNEELTNNDIYINDCKDFLSKNLILENAFEESFKEFQRKITNAIENQEQKINRIKNNGRQNTNYFEE